MLSNCRGFIIVLYVIVKIIHVYPFDAASHVNCSTESSNAGREFVFGLIDGYPGYITTITLNVVSEAPGNMWLRAPFIGMNAHYPFHTGTNQIYIPPKLIQNSNATIENKTIHLLSDIDIVVNVITAGSSYHAEEGFLALPRLESATQFIVATGIPYNSRPSEILIASYENTTTVSLTYPQGLTFNTVSVNLSEYKTYMFRSIYDLSGTYIQSSRPISVIAGNTNTMPIGAYVSYTIEQVPPTDFLGNEYLVPPLRRHSIYKLKILSPNYNAVLTLQNSTGTFRFMLYSDLPLAVFNKNEPAFISSSKPIMVVQFGLGFMTTVPSISNYLRRYDFLVPTITASVVNYVCIISTTTDDIVLDSVKPTGKNISFMNTTKGNFTVMTTSVAIGRHSITSMSGTLYFGAILYGYTTYTGYAFPLGLRATSGAYATCLHRCGGASKHRWRYSIWICIRPGRKPRRQSGCLTASTPTPSATTGQMSSPTTGQMSSPTTGQMSKTSFSRTTSATKPVTATHSAVSAFNGTGLYCFSCPEVSHLYLCNKVTRCKSSEVCSTSMFTTTTGLVKYRTGCMDEEICQTVRTPRNSKPMDCVECCKGNFCNSHGCQGQGLPDRASRGPLCFDCMNVESVDECDTVSLCHPDELCSIEELEWGASWKHVNMGCASHQCVPAKRSTPSCQNCCHEDLCNSNCTNTPPVPMIG